MFDAAVETLAMLGGVQALPFEPEVMLQLAAAECPGEPGFVGSIEGECFALERREQIMGAIAVGPCGEDRWRVAAASRT